MSTKSKARPSALSKNERELLTLIGEVANPCCELDHCCDVMAGRLDRIPPAQG